MLDRAQDTLQALADLFTEGSIVVVDRPNAPFQSALRCRGRTDAEVFACVPESHALSHAGANGGGLPASSTIVGGADARLFADGRQIAVASLDRLFAPLRRCAALQIGPCPELVEILEGATRTVEKCGPVLILEAAERQLDAVRRWLSLRAYTVRVDERGGDVLDGLRGLEARRLLVATTRGTAAAPPRASLQVKQARSSARHEPRLHAWQGHLPAADLAAMNGVSTDREEDRSVFWTGPSLVTTFRIWLPCAGPYEIELQVLEDHGKPNAAKLHVGDIGSAQVSRAADGSVVLRREVLVSETQAEEGLIVAFSTDGPTWRTIGERPRLTGVAVLGLTVRAKAIAASV